MATSATGAMSTIALNSNVGKTRLGSPTHGASITGAKSTNPKHTAAM